MAAALNEDARKKANLRLLQRSIDPNIVDIVGSATHVVLYEYTQGWEKSQVEGSLFLVAAQSGGQQQYSLAILNRHSTDNFHVPVTHTFQLQHKEPYLIFKQSPKILGIWFHNANERVIMASLLNQAIENLKGAAAAAPHPAQQQQTPPQHQRPPQPMPPKASPVPMMHQHQQQPRTAVSPMAQQIPQQQGTPVNRQAQANVASPSHLIEPLMNSLFVSPAAAGVGTPNNDANATPPRNIPGVALDKKSLQLALLSLIQDDRFIDLLHAQYLKVAHARASRNNKK